MFASHARKPQIQQWALLKSVDGFGCNRGNYLDEESLLWPTLQTHKAKKLSLHISTLYFKTE